MPFSLPAELVSLVLSYIDWKPGRKDLKRLALTSSTFVEPCQRILFSHIGLTTSTSGRQFLNLFTVSPWIASYVKRLTISESHPSSGNWLQSDLDVVKVLRMLNLSDIRSFTLSRDVLSTWDTLSAPVRRAIVDVCRSPALVHLDLHWVPVTLVSVCGPRLKHLRLFHCSGVAVKEATPFQYTNSPIINLRTLELWSDLGAVARFLFEPSNRIRLHEVRNLEVQTYSTSYFPYLQAFVECSRASLQSLTFRPALDLSTQAENLSISGYPYLTNLELTIVYSFSWAATFICSIPPSNAIQFIRLNLYFSKESRKPSNETALRRIGRFVDTPGLLPYLRTFEVGVRTEDRERAKAAQVNQAWTPRSLAISAARDLVYFESLDDPKDHNDYERGSTQSINIPHHLPVGYNTK